VLLARQVIFFAVVYGGRTVGMRGEFVKLCGALVGVLGHGGFS
jgi:hypothetical protein